MIPFFSKRLDISGYNASISPSATGYFGFVRNVERTGTQCKNKIAYFTLSNSFETTSFLFLEDKTGRTIHTGWSSGLEDPRLISETELFAVTNDTNTLWMSDFSKIKVSGANILEVKPYFVKDISRQGEKNWLLLNTFGNDYHFLHSLNPLRIVRIDKRLCEGNVLMESCIHDLSGIIHNGACVNLGSSGFLVSARFKNKHSYNHSRWILLDPSYKFQCVSPPFRFEPKEFVNEDGTFKDGEYEMNMSLHLEGDDLVCCTSHGDRYTTVKKYKLSDVLRFIGCG